MRHMKNNTKRMMRRRREGTNPQSSMFMIRANEKVVPVHQYNRTSEGKTESFSYGLDSDPISCLLAILSGDMTEIFG
jgi:hypothetical protein